MKWTIEYFEQEDTKQPASTHDFNKAFDYWTEYQKTRRVSPVQHEETTQ